MTNPKLQLPFIVSLITLVLIAAIFILKPFLATLALALVCAVVLTPLYKWILQLTHNRQALASWITVSISIIGVILPLIFLGTQVFQEAVQLYSSLNQEDTRQQIITVTTEKAGEVIEKFIPGAGRYLQTFSDNLDTYIKNGLAWLIGHLGIALSGVSSFLLDLLIFFISLYYFIRDGSSIKKAIFRISPLDQKDDEIVFTRLTAAINSVIKGNLLIALIQGILTGIGFALFGVPNSVLWGMLAVIAALIPRIGTAIIFIPAIIYLFIMGSSLMAFLLLIWGIFGVGVVDNILGPKLIGKELELHPLFILLSAIGGLVLFGPVGIFLGPLTISLLFALVSVYVDISTRNTKKDISHLL